MENEIWKEVVGYEGLYAVSNMARVQSIKYRSGKNVQFLSQHCNSKKYYRVGLTKYGVQKGKYVHILVAQAFLGDKPNGFECNHKDGDKSHNYLHNLEYITPTENSRHAWQNGLIKPPLGERNPACKLTAEKVLEIRRKYAEGVGGLSSLGREYGVHHGMIYLIVNRKKWKHI